MTTKITEKLAKRTNGTRRVITKIVGPSMTEQHHKKACDINTIMAKYRKTGLIDHMSTHQPTYGDVTGADFETAQKLVAEQKSIFQDLPAAVRAEFDNDPAQYLALVETDEGVDELRSILYPPPEEEAKDASEGVSEAPTEQKKVTEPVT